MRIGTIVEAADLDSAVAGVRLAARPASPRPGSPRCSASTPSGVHGRRPGGARGDRPISVVAALRTVVTNDPDDARERTGQAVAFYGSLPPDRAMLDRAGAAEPTDVSIVGDEDHVASVIRGLADIGVTDFVAVPAGTPEELEHTRKLLPQL